MVGKPSREEAVSFGYTLAEKHWPAAGRGHHVSAVEVSFSAAATIGPDGTTTVVLRRLAAEDAEGR